MSNDSIDLRRATILIGGQLTRETRERMIDAILADGTGPAMRQYFANTDELIDAVKTAVETGSPLQLADHRARDGRFAAIEQTCRAHDLAFRRHSFARARHDGEIHLHIPGITDYAVSANQAGVPYATHAEIREWAQVRRELKTLVTQLEGVLQQIPPLTAL